jgi:hypothetical protein
MVVLVSAAVVVMRAMAVKAMALQEVPLGTQAGCA